MSRECEDQYAVYAETYPRARKVHACFACRERIEVGDRYARVGTIFDDNVAVYKRCMRCQKIHQHLRELGEYDSWPDEGLRCGMEYAEHWGKEPPPEIAALAFATREELQT